MNDTDQQPAAGSKSSDAPAQTNEVPIKPRRQRRMARAAGAEEPTSPNTPVASPTPKDRGPSKIAGVIALLQRGEGATLPELVEATGWLPHTMRAALTGLKKKGHVITKSSRDGATCYAIEKLG